MGDAISVKSYASSRMSGASNLSKKTGSKVGGAPKYDDAESIRSGLETESVRSRPMTAYSNLNEDDEWTAIMNFNTILHYEE